MEGESHVCCRGFSINASDKQQLRGTVRCQRDNVGPIDLQRSRPGNGKGQVFPSFPLQSTRLLVANPLRNIDDISSLAARTQRKPCLDAADTVGRQDGVTRFTEIVLRPHLVIARGTDRERALRMLEKSEKQCLVSASLSTPIRLEPEITER